MNNIMKLANGPVMWTIALVTVGIAILESVFIYRRAKKFIAMTDLLTGSEMKSCMKTGGIVAIGPATSAFVVALSMISMMGAPITLMRVGMIGAPATELMSAGIGTEAAGVVLGTNALTGPALAAALWSCAILSSGYLILVPIMTRGLGVTLGKLMNPKEDGKKSIWIIIFGAVLPLIVFGALAFSQVTRSIIHAATFGTAAVVMFILNKAAKKNDIGWLKQWAMGIAVLCAMVVGGIMINV